MRDTLHQKVIHDKYREAYSGQLLGSYWCTL